MRRFHKEPQVVYQATELAARILREIAMASEAGSAEIRFRFLQDWEPNKYRSDERGLGVHIECGREDSFLHVLKPPCRIDFPNTLPTIFDGLAKLMSSARAPNSTITLQLEKLLNGIDDER